MLQVEPVTQLCTLLEALANLTTDAVARLHNPLAMCRTPRVKALDNMLHAMTLIEAARERINNIMLRR